MKRLDARTVYLISTAVSTFAFSAAFTTSAVYRYEMAALNPLQLVLLGTMLEGSVFVAEIPTGVVADLVSRRLSVIVGFALIGLGMLLEGSWQLFSTILLAQAVWGVGYTFISGAEDAWLAGELGEERLTAVYLRGSQVAQLAALAGIATNVFLAERMLNLPFFAGGLAHLLLALFLVLFMPEEKFAPTPQEERDTWRAFRATLQAGLGSIRARPLLMTILGISFFYGLYSEGLDRLWQPHFLENAAPPAWNGFSSVTWFGVIQAAVMLVTVVVAEAARRHTEALSPQRMTLLLAGLTGLITAGLVLFGMAGSFSVALGAYMTVAIVRRTLQPLYSAWTNRGIPTAVRATVLSTLGQMDAVGQVVGGPAIGIIANQFGIRPAIILSGIVLSPALLLYRRAFRQTQEAAVAADEPASA